MIFEMLWLGSILLYAGLYLWGYVVNHLPRARWRGAAMSGKETPR